MNSIMTTVVKKEEHILKITKWWRRANGREGSGEKRRHVEGADLTGVVPFKVSFVSQCRS
jgi:hypothetical protein